MRRHDLVLPVLALALLGSLGGCRSQSDSPATQAEVINPDVDTTSNAATAEDMGAAPGASPDENFSNYQ